jgi:hypothetical protein
MAERLIELLKQIEDNADIEDYKGDIIPATNIMVQEASYTADQLLISSHGDVNWDMIDVLNKDGYYVFPLERDRFGWLVGGIATKKGTIAFG